jgi:hypothetical protein
MLPDAVVRVLTPNERSLYMMLAAECDPRTRVYTSTITDLAASERRARRTVERALRGLREHGLVAFDANRSRAPTAFKIAHAPHPYNTVSIVYKDQGSAHEETPSEAASVNGSEGSKTRACP